MNVLKNLEWHWNAICHVGKRLWCVEDGNNEIIRTHNQSEERQKKNALLFHKFRYDSLHAADGV